MWGSLTLELLLWGSLTVTLRVWGSFTLELLLWGSLTVTLWVWSLFTLELLLWGSLTVTLWVWSLFTLELLLWGSLTVMLRVWSSFTLELLLWSSLTVTLRVWSSFTLELLLWGSLTVTYECEPHSHLSYYCYIMVVKTEQYVQKVRVKSHRSLLARLRGGTAPLQIETGGYIGLPVEERICRTRNTRQVEDEQHFCGGCPALEEARAPLLYLLNLHHVDTGALSDEDKFIAIMQSPDGRTAKLLYNMFLKRNS